MKINDDHLYHGAALTQIAEHPQFTAINAFREGKKISRCSFLVNQDISVYLKYASKPTGRFKEYIFTFQQQHLEEIEEIKNRAKNTFIVMVCVKKEICCISYDEFFDLIRERIEEKGSEEDSYTILVTVPKNKSLRVYMNAPGVKKTMLTEKVVPRKRFPGVIFEESDNA